MDLFVLKKIKEGDIKAFESIFRLYYTPLCLYATSITGELEVAEEIVQAVGEILFRYDPRMVAAGTKTGFQARKQHIRHRHPYIRTDSVMYIRQVDKRCTECLPDGLLSEADA